MSENGRKIFKIGGKIGTRTFQFDDASPKVDLDVIHVSNQWFEIDAQFRNPDGKIDESRLMARADEAVRFAQELLQAKEMDKASAFHFIKLIDDEVEALKPFFEPKSAAKRDSPENSKVIFSE